MKYFSRYFGFIYLLIFCFNNTSSGQEQKFAQLGEFKLKSGEIIHECQIGYRTFGTLNSDQSNAILFPTWALGTSEQLISNIGKDRLVDDAKYFIIAVDALCNGVSSSPSNSKIQPRMNFPEVTIDDMVNSQYELLTKILKINHLKCVMGVSMGGMQAFQWMVAYPEFMDKVIPIVGSPRVPPYDMVLQRAQIRSITNDPEWNNGNYKENPARVAEAEFLGLILTTPDDFNKNNTRENVFAKLDNAKGTKGFDSNDRIRQLQAIITLDVARSFSGSFALAAATVKAKTLIIAALKDHIVSPGPALEFGELLKAKILKLDSDCGHLSPGCESGIVNKAVSDFLEE
jgi:homoserine O-acetyltransferase